MANKRKRDELSVSDSDEVAPGRQILPVANLPADFDQEPQDGMQYLFLVRRDARRLPQITRVRNPYEVSETRVAHTPTPPSTNVTPCKEWRVTFQTRFSNLRKNLAQVTTNGNYYSRRRVIPEKKDRDAWWKYLAGHPESAWGPRNPSVGKKLFSSTHARAFVAEVTPPGDVTGLRDVQSIDEFHQPPVARNISHQPNALDYTRSMESPNVALLTSDFALSEETQKELTEQLSPPEATPGHLREIDHRTSMHLLMYFTHWINVHVQNPSDPMTTISISHARWIFALLTKIEDQLSADEMNLLRNLARACLGLVQRYINQGAKNDTVLGEESQPVLAENMTRMSDASCWMVFTAIAGHWGQRDLWADAEATLAQA